MGKRKKTKKQILRNKLDKLWRTVGKEDAFCEICATLPPHERVNYTQLHPHHIIGRGAAITRWDLVNRIWVCPSHHTLGNKCAEYNQGGWFWDKSGNTGWMGTHRLEDKKYLVKLRGQTKVWNLSELEALLADLESR